jgi:5-formyltetrahydrofolate cyclo-ligase
MLDGMDEALSARVQPPHTATKAAWRRWAKAQRDALPVEALSARVVEHLRAWEGYRQAAHLLVYAAFGSELDLSALLQDDKRFYFTRTASESRDLTLHAAEGGLERHRYGYVQPKAGAALVAPEQIDLALVPGLAFDERGVRLGYGLGYFDRLLPRLRPQVPRVGITADALVVPALPHEPHDMRMTHLASESGIWKV